MTREEMLGYILDSVPYRVVFVDMDHIIRYMNREAQYHYHTVRGYDNLIGKSIFECHSEKSKEMLLAAVEKLKNHGNEIYLGVSVYNERKYINPVRDENGVMIGYFERFERNIQK
ncbi:MAG: PAS domain-containing protein [Clostridia bacterium]|nr:PAS domain-containing protein [Clostridia bacterium]